jgi:hypothetical protein
MPDNKGKKKRDPKNPYGNYEFDRSTKVSPAIIKQIKTLGMTKALASASSNKGNAAYMEGLKRMYGAKRVANAMGSASSGSAGPKMGGGSGRATAKTSAGPKMGGGQGYKNAPKKARSTGSQVGRGAAIAGAAAYGAGVYKQSKSPAKGIISGRPRGANVPGRVQRTAYNAAIKGGKTPAQAMRAANMAKAGKLGLAAGKLLTKKTIIGTAALTAAPYVAKAAKKITETQKKSSKLSPTQIRANAIKNRSGGKGY